MICADSGVRRAQPLAPWVGGKRSLAARIIRRIEGAPHDFYGEPFVGMGGVFLRRARPAPVEAINDRSNEVVNLFRVVRRHPDALAQEMQLQLVSRSEFKRLLAVPPDTLTDIERAARFILLQRLAYGGRPGSTSFPARRVRADSLDADFLRGVINGVHRRLGRVTIEHLDFGEFLDRYDRDGALFYLDPPYWGCEGYYGPGMFSRADFGLLSKVLRRLRGKFLLSINDVPEVRDLFGWARIEEEPVTYRVGRTAKPVVELVISSP